MDPKLVEMLERLSELTEAEIKDLDKQLVGEFNRLDKLGNTPENVDLMEQVAEATGRVRAEGQAKATAAAEAADRATSLREQMNPKPEAKPPVDKPEGVEGEAKPPVEAVDDKGDKPGKPDEKDGKPGDGQPGQIAATAGAPNLGDIESPGQVIKNKNVQVVRASGQWKSVGAVRGPNTPERGSIFESQESLAEATVEAVESLGRGSGDPVLIASLVTTYPPERTLGRDAMENYAKLEAVTGRQALVATGGICAPVGVDYNINVGSSDEEPIAAGLPDFNATRGGLRFLLTPTFAGVGATGTGIWTAATDATPGGATKPIQAIACGTETVVYVDAISTRLRFGNMMDRFSPEVVAANTSLAMANAARVREINRLTKIDGFSTAVSSGQLLGAARDFLATLDQACAAARYRHRLPDNTPMMAILPRFVKDMIRADFVREMAHDNNSFSLTDAQIESLLAARNCRAIWTLDGQAGATAAGVTYPQQGFAAQTTGALLDWPRILVWYLFPTGAFQRLDGGRLDVGVVRDSVLDGTNDYETFVETFENIAFRGYESLKIISALRPNGGSAGTINTTTY